MVNKTFPDKGPSAPATRLALAKGGGAAAETYCDDARTTRDETSVDNISIAQAGFAQKDVR